MAEMDDDELLHALGVEVAPLKASHRTPREERIIAGFEDILRFHQAHGRAPLQGEGRDIGERLYAVRLDQIRKLPEAQTLLLGLDGPGLLSGAAVASADVDELDEDALLAELGMDDGPTDHNDITVLRHVRSSVEKRAAEDIADRTPCADFERFQALFELVEQDLKSGVHKALRFGRDTSITNGNYFIVGGQLAYVAEIGDTIRAPNGESDARLRVIYANGTESNLLRRSLQRALYKDDLGRRLSDPDMGPLFGDESEPDDIGSGTIYVLRSQSNHPFVEPGSLHYLDCIPAAQEQDNMTLTIRMLATLALLTSASAWCASTAFSDSYAGAGGAGTCDTNYAITGLMPDDQALHPIFVYLVGTTEAYDNGQAMAAITRMAQAGFVAASVQYRSEVFGTCAEIAKKAACIFKPKVSGSAIGKLCARGNCGKGIVVSGFSQGAIAAILAKNTDKRVKAVYGMGALASYATYNLASCMNNRKHVLPSSNLRIVNGEKDQFAGGVASQVRTSSQAVTGKICGPNATSCLNNNGSGWIMVRNSEVRDRSADHCYQRAAKDCFGNPNALDANWRAGKANWTLPANLKWLRTFVSP